MKNLILILTIFLSGCSGLYFYPDNIRVTDPSEFGLKYSEEILQDGLGPDLVYWDVPAKGKYKGTVLFLHGNAGNISSHFRSVAWLPENGYRVLAFDYRGYGGSKGETEIRGVHKDVERMFRYLVVQEPQRSKRILFGQSVGASIGLYVASYLDREDIFVAVIADSAFSSYREIAREKMDDLWLLYPFQYPLSLFVLNSYSPIDVVDKITTPVLYIHGEADKIVLPHHSKDLCLATRGYCTLWMMPGEEHIAALNTVGTRQRLLGWLAAVTKGEKPKTLPTPPAKKQPVVNYW